MNKYYIRNKKVKINLLHLYIAVESIIYVCFLYLDIRRINISISNAMKYISILICFLFVVLPFKNVYDPKNTQKYDNVDITLLRLAFLFTIISDYFLLFTRAYIVGLMCFVVVQLFYLLRIYRWKAHTSIRKESQSPIYMYLIRNLLVTCVIVVLLIILLITSHIKINPLSQINSLRDSITLPRLTIILAVFYFTSIVLNLIDSIIVAQKTQTIQSKIFSLGLLLFVLCDINVGIFNVIKIFELDKSGFNIARQISLIGMWFFYLPSQLLISISKYSLKSN